MNRQLIFCVGILFVIFIFCSKTIDGSKLQKRGGVVFEINKEKPFSGQAINYYPNDQKQAETIYSDGKKNGIKIVWYKNGQKKYQVKYMDDLLNGRCVGWQEDGRPKFEGIYKNNIKNGKFIIYDYLHFDQKNAKFELFCKNDKINGIYSIWIEEIKRFEGTMSPDQGLEVSTFQIWNEKGENIYNGKYNDVCAKWANRFAFIAPSELGSISTFLSEKNTNF